MTSEEAFSIAYNLLSKERTNSITRSVLDRDNFGNFIIDFLDVDGSRSLICDRDQVYICADSSGKDCRLIVQSLYHSNKQEFLHIMQKLL